MVIVPLFLAACGQKDQGATPIQAVTTRYTLTYTAGENGSIRGTSPQRVEQGSSGSPVTAVAAPGYLFSGWSDGAQGATRTDSNVTGDIMVTARFVPARPTLSYSAGDHGSIDGAVHQQVDHGGSGSPVTAVAAPGYHFTAWSDGVQSATRTESNVTDNFVVTARFAIDRHSLTYLAGEHGAITGARQQKVAYGGAGSPVRAIPEKGYQFSAWSDGSTANPRKDAPVKDDLQVTARFARIHYTLTYAAQANGSIEGPNPQDVAYGDDGDTVTAVPAAGYHFVAWSDGLTTATRREAKVVGAQTVSAVFAVNTYTIGGQVTGLVKGTRLVLQNNGGEDLTVTTTGKFSFPKQVLTTTPYAVSVLTQPTGPNQTCSVIQGTGQVDAKDVTAIGVNCVVNTYTIGGTVVGLPAGKQVVLQYNDGAPFPVPDNGPFLFGKALKDGSSYQVKVLSPPKLPHWACTIEHGTGVLSGGKVTNVAVDCHPEVLVQTIAGIRKISLNWNAQDFSGGSFDLCIAQKEIPPGEFDHCGDLKGGKLETKVGSPRTITGLTNDIPYWFQVVSHFDKNRKVLSKAVKARAYGGLNDTGIEWCADNTSNHYRQKGQGRIAGFPKQDGTCGRDMTARTHRLKKTGSGLAGFDFTKLCRDGETAGEGDCPANPSPGEGPHDWACTRDNVTGLTWEIKTASGLQGKDNTFTWYNSDASVNGGLAGVRNLGHCTGTSCDTDSYARAINKQGLCGAHDWRVPTRRELLSIVDNGHSRPAIDKRFFPNATSTNYWSSLPYPDGGSSAWQVYFLYGEAASASKSHSNNLRLVRGRTATFGPHSATSPDADFSSRGDGTITDRTTGLMWMDCSLGQSWDGGDCVGPATGFSWEGALKAASVQRFAGHSDWRLPNKNELESIVEGRRYTPAIDSKLFPDTPPAYFWTSSPYAASASAAWSVDFGFGAVNASVKSGKMYVRLVRDLD